MHALYERGKHCFTQLLMATCTFSPHPSGSHPFPPRAPAMTCVEFLHKNPRRPDPGIAVDASELAVAVGHAARAAGLVPVACTCDWHPWKYAPASARDVQMVSSVDTAQDVMDTFRRAAY